MADFLASFFNIIIPLMMIAGFLTVIAFFKMVFDTGDIVVVGIVFLGVVLIVAMFFGFTQGLDQCQADCARMGMEYMRYDSGTLFTDEGCYCEINNSSTKIW